MKAEGETMKTATRIRQLDGFTGEAALYRVSPPMQYDIPWDDGDPPAKTTDFVVVSATIAMLTGPETYIFPAEESGKVINFGELDGSYRGGLSHERALREAGYEVTT